MDEHKVHRAARCSPMDMIAAKKKSNAHRPTDGRRDQTSTRKGNSVREIQGERQELSSQRRDGGKKAEDATVAIESAGAPSGEARVRGSKDSSEQSAAEIKRRFAHDKGVPQRQEESDFSSNGDSGWLLLGDLKRALGQPSSGEN